MMQVFNLQIQAVLKDSRTRQDTVIYLNTVFKRTLFEGDNLFYMMYSYEPNPLFYIYIVNIVLVLVDFIFDLIVDMNIFNKTETSSISVTKLCLSAFLYTS